MLFLLSCLTRGQLCCFAANMTGRRSPVGGECGAQQQQQEQQQYQQLLLLLWSMCIDCCAQAYNCRTANADQLALVSQEKETEMETKKEVETEVETQTEEPSAKARAWRQRFYGQLLARSLSQSRSPSLLGSNLGSGIHWSCSFVVFAMIINQFFHIIWLELNSLFESFKKIYDCCCCSCRLSVYLSDRQCVCLSFLL